MKIKRYNIQQLKLHNIALSYDEQRMLLGGNSFREGLYGVTVYDDNGEFLQYVRYDQITASSATANLVGYAMSSKIVNCTMLNNSSINASFTVNLNSTILQELERNRTDFTTFKDSAQGSTNDHYYANDNLICLKKNADNQYSPTTIVHEVIHSFQEESLHMNTSFDNSINLEYQSHVLAELYTKLNDKSVVPSEDFGWLGTYVKTDSKGKKYVTSGILSALGTNADEWHSNSNSASRYNTRKNPQGQYATWHEDFNYQWSTMLQKMGIEVRNN